MKLPRFLVDFVLGSDNAKREISKIISDKIQEERKEFVKETTEVISTQVKKSIPPRKYVTTNTQKDLFAGEQASGKNSNVLWTVYSDSPGSVQSANRMIDAVMGGGYVLEKEVGAGRSATAKDLKRLIKFLDRPNPDSTIETIIKAGLENFLAYGDWYMEKVPTRRTRGGRGFTIAELYNTDTAYMSILVDPEQKKRGVLKKVGYKRKTEEQKAVIYDVNEICQISRPSPTAGVYGKAVLETNQSVLQLLLQALTYNISVLKNGGRPPLQIILPEDTNEADADSVNTFLENNNMGTSNAGKNLVLFKGAKAEVLGISPQDMAYLELIMTGIKLVAGQYGVPLFLIGFPESSNRASASELRRAFYYTNVYPLRKLISHKITNEIIKEGMGIEGWKFSFRAQGLEESESTRRDTMTAWTRGLITWNEARIKMGLLPQNEEWADGYYLLGSKNDSLLEIGEAVGKEPDEGATDVPNIKPSGEQGEGADLTPEGGEKETEKTIKKMESLLKKLSR